MRGAADEEHLPQVLAFQLGVGQDPANRQLDVRQDVPGPGFQLNPRHCYFPGVVVEHALLVGDADDGAILARQPALGQLALLDQAGHQVRGLQLGAFERQPLHLEDARPWCG